MDINKDVDLYLANLKDKLATIEGLSTATSEQILNEFSLLLPFITNNSQMKTHSALLEGIQTKSDQLFNLKQQEISKQALLSSLSKTVEIQKQCIEILDKLKHNLSAQTAQFASEIAPKVASLQETKASLQETLLLKDKIANSTLPLDTCSESQINAKMVNFDLSLLPKSPA